MLAADTETSILTGDAVRGTVVKKVPFGVFVDIGLEHPALLEMIHMIDPRKNGVPNVGETIAAVIIGWTNGYAS